MSIAQVFVGGSSLKETQIIFALVDEVEITHGFQYRPRVLITDSDGNIIQADVKYTDRSTILVSFSQSLSGFIYLR